MLEIRKARWEADGENHFHVDFDFAKVNKEKRLVSGFATLNNVDTQNDIVESEASADAFARARGNLREMHKKDSAVGKIVSFTEKSFMHEGKKYNGIFVTAYVSKGAQDTWEKVLDGTLSGFSIGGSIIDAEEDFSKGGDSPIRVIKKYDLTELSLVDNPGNQLANVFHIQKSVDGSVTVDGMVAETKVVNVFICDEHEIVLQDEDDKQLCPVCDASMTNIGWVEGQDDSKKVNEIVSKYLHSDTDAISKGGDEEVALTKKIIKSADEPKPEETEDESVETGHEAGDPAEVPTPAEPAQPVDEVKEEETDTPEAVEEVHDDEEKISKAISELQSVVKDSLDSTREETRAQVEKLEKQINELNKSFTSKASEFEAKFAELDENFEVAKSRLANFEKSLQKMNSEGALRKSADSEETVEVEQDNDPWAGSAFSVRGLLR